MLPTVFKILVRSKLDHEEEFLYYEGDRVLEQDAQRGCGESFYVGIQDPPGHFHVWSTVGSLL